MSISRGCRILGVSRQAVYQHRQRQLQRTRELASLLQWVQSYRMLMPRLGGRKLYSLLKARLVQHGIKLGRDGFFGFLREQDLLVKPKRNYTKTTWSRHWMRKHPNRLKEAPPPSAPEQVLVADITYVKSREGTHYLSLVTDAYSRKIMGYHLSDDMSTTEVVKALHMATHRRSYCGKMIHHSDRGLQYCAAQYQQALCKAHISPSMTDGYDCYQNALAERVNGILKGEFLLHRCNTFDELKELVDESVRIYNEVRPHLSLKMQTPQAVHEQYGLIQQKESQIQPVSGSEKTVNVF